MPIIHLKVEGGYIVGIYYNICRGYLVATTDIYRYNNTYVYVEQLLIILKFSRIHSIDFCVNFFQYKTIHKLFTVPLSISGFAGGVAGGECYLQVVASCIGVEV